MFALEVQTTPSFSSTVEALVVAAPAGTHYLVAISVWLKSASECASFCYVPSLSPTWAHNCRTAQPKTVWAAVVLRVSSLWDAQRTQRWHLRDFAAICLSRGGSENSFMSKHSCSSYSGREPKLRTSGSTLTFELCETRKPQSPDRHLKLYKLCML